jgi:hypothetical protein
MASILRGENTKVLAESGAPGNSLLKISIIYFHCLLPNTKEDYLERDKMICNQLITHSMLHFCIS